MKEGPEGKSQPERKENLTRRDVLRGGLAAAIAGFYATSDAEAQLRSTANRKSESLHWSEFDHMATEEVIPILEKELGRGGRLRTSIDAGRMSPDDLKKLFELVDRVCGDLTYAHNAIEGVQPELERFLLRDTAQAPGMVTVKAFEGDSPVVGNGHYVRFKGKFFLVTARHVIGRIPQGERSPEFFFPDLPTDLMRGTQRGQLPDHPEDYAFLPVDARDVHAFTDIPDGADREDCGGQLHVVLSEKDGKVRVIYGIPLSLSDFQLRLIEEPTSFTTPEAHAVRGMALDGALMLIPKRMLAVDARDVGAVQGRSGSLVLRRRNQAFIPATTLNATFTLGSTVVPGRAAVVVSASDKFYSALNMAHAMALEHPPRLSSYRHFMVTPVKPSARIIAD